MRKSYRDDNGEKIFRYSIRKYHFGAASVAVAALMFFANGAVAASETITPATTSDVVTTGSDGNADGDSGASDEGDSKKALTNQPAELKAPDEVKTQEVPAEEAEQGNAVSKPAEVDSNSSKPESAQETPQAEGEKEQKQPTVANTEVAKSTQGNLQALLEKLTLSSMQELHAEVEAGLAAAKAVLSDPKATQAQVDEQTRAMEALISRVNQALTPALENPTILEKAGLASTDLTSTGITSTGLATPDGAVTEQPTGGKRRRGGGLSAAEPATTQVAPSAGGNTTAAGANSQTTPQALPTYTNTEGKNGVYDLKDELEFITDQLRANGASADKIQAAKAAADKFNEAFSKGNTISQEDFSAALTDLKKSRELIEGVLREKDANAGEVTGPVNPAESATPSENNVTIQPRTNTRGWSGFRNVPAGAARTRAPRAADRAANGSFIDAKRHYFDNDFDITSPYTNYTYVYWNKKSVQAGDRPDDVADIIKYLKEDVERTSTGFRWRITINPSHANLDNVSFLFTTPSGQSLKSNSVTITKQTNQGSTSFNRAASGGKDELVSTMEAAGFREVSKGTPNNTNAPATTNNLGSPLYYNVSSVLGWIREEKQGGFYNRGNPRDANASNGYENQDEQNKSNQKAQQIVNSSGNTYYGRLEGNTAYQIEFETIGGDDLDKLDYLSSIKGFQDSRRYFGLQIHSRLDSEVKSTGNFRFELRKNGYFQVDQDHIAAEFGTAAWSYTTNQNGRTYQSVPNGDFDATDPRVKGIATYTKTAYIWDYNDFDIRNYGIYKDKSGATISNGYSEAENKKQTFEFYKGTTTTTTTKEITTEVATKPGVHTYTYRRSFADGSQDKGTIHFVTKPKRPVLDTDFSGLDEGRHNITASNGTEGYKMVLFKKEPNGSLTKVAEQLAGADGRATFNNVDVKLGEYLVKTVVDGEWSDYKNKDAQRNDIRH